MNDLSDVDINRIKKEIKDALVELYEELGRKYELIGDIKVSKVAGEEIEYTFTCAEIKNEMA